ncbi:MAG TPA: GDP-mannose 4,6-dehydratase [Chitinophagaceae bacterium]|nr:GDP-mannose 4,6-dehydratase [Chitinophagaceae bacterium]
MESKKKALITGGAGFIGSHLIDFLLNDGNYNITCIDNFDDFYDPEIKRKNIEAHIGNVNFKLIEADITDHNLINRLEEHYDIIVHLAAKAGVRPSIQNPVLYQHVNVVGLQNILEIARLTSAKQFVFASSSSVYGINPNYPWKESDKELMPVSPYASSKIAGEWLGKVFSHLYNMRFIALRFFTVYGPRQRPDLAINNFTGKIINGEPIDFFGDGNTLRDYTYIKDIVSGIVSAIQYNKSNFEIINLGNNHPVTLSQLVSGIEKVLNKKAIRIELPEQEGDVPVTCADISKAQQLLNYDSLTKLEDGLELFVNWKLNNKNK